MKTKISIDILSDETLLLTIADFVGKHNAGKLEVDFNLLEAFAKMEKIKYSHSNKYLKVWEFANKSVGISVTEDSTPFCILTWKEINELDENIVQLAEDIYPEITNHQTISK